MKRNCIAIMAAIGAVMALCAASASAQITELGSTSTALVAPACPAGVTPANCTIILTQVTALETIRDGSTYPTTVKQPGYIVAFTIGLSNLSGNRATRKADIKFLDHQYGGTTRAAITVLRPTGPASQRKYTVVAEGPIVHLQPYLGEVVQFPLTTALPVQSGDVLGLTVPTWAPVLSIQLPTAKFAYRQSRSSNCSSPPSTQQAQLTIGAAATYMCSYPGTRLEYTATEVTTPTVPSNYVHAPDRRHAKGRVGPSPAGTR
jgi:hypothetical protein